EAGQLADAVTLRAEFEHSGLLDEVGGPAYLAQLLSAMVGVINAGEYGQVIYDAWLRRQLVDLGEVVVNRAFGADAELDAKAQLEAAEQSLFELAKEGGAGEGGFLTFERALTLAVHQAEKAFTTPGGVSGLPSGLRDLDNKTGGLHPSDLLIIAGRPGMGKTALATKIAFGAAKSVLRAAQEADPNAVPKGGVALFSLEMSADQLATRLLAEESRISGDRIRRGEISQRDFDRFLEVSRELASLPLHIDDTPAISISALRTRCRRLQRTKGLDLIVVDYLQLMRPAAGTRPESRVLEISMITQGLKALAKELSVPVIALSQLSRAVETREDKRPQLSDLRESGSIEQDADVVMFVYRDEYYLMQRAPKELSFDNAEKFQGAVDKWQKDMEMAHNKAELIIAKQRHGPTGTIKLFFEAEFTRFGDLDTQHDDGFAG
ncbi:MAG: replicative DNA helicase, partial [Alphaproteobacteria bacterium]